MKSFLNRMKRVDMWLCIRIAGWHGRKWVDRIMRNASRLGNGYLYPAIGTSVSVLDSSIAGRFIPASVVSFFIELVAYAVIKFRIRRFRPSFVLPQIKNKLPHPDPFSFPSGHTAGAFVMATLMAHFYPTVSIPSYFTASIIGFSRIYNGVHYPSDVMAGSLLGVLSAKLGLYVIA